jgi:hypothetical protein
VWGTLVRTSKGRKVLSVRPSAEPDDGEVVHDWEKPGTGNKAWSAEPGGGAGVATLVDCAEEDVDVKEALPVPAAALIGVAREVDETDADVDPIAAATDLWQVARRTRVGRAATVVTRNNKRRMNVLVVNMIEEIAMRGRMVSGPQGSKRSTGTAQKKVAEVRRGGEMSVSLALHDKTRETDVGQNNREGKARRWFLKQHKFFSADLRFIV